MENGALIYYAPFSILLHIQRLRQYHDAFLIFIPRAGYPHSLY